MSIEKVGAGGTAPSPGLIVDAAEDDFETAVVARSHQLPVLVDIGADENMRIAGRHKVRGFPTVIAYSHGVEIDRFHSAQTEGFVRRFLDSVISRHAEHGHAALLAPAPALTSDGK